MNWFLAATATLEVKILLCMLYVTLSTAVLKLLFTWPFGLHDQNGPIDFLNTTKVTAPRSCLVWIKVRRDCEIC